MLTLFCPTPVQPSIHSHDNNKCRAVLELITLKYLQMRPKNLLVVKCFLFCLCFFFVVVIRERSCSDVFSSVSLKSDQSKGDGPNLSEKKTLTKKGISHILYFTIALSNCSAVIECLVNCFSF